MSKPIQTITEKLLIRRNNLPHWQFGGSTYFITFRSFRGNLSDDCLRQVMTNILFDHGRRMDLHFGVIMPDHVHLILQPRQILPNQWHDLSRIMQGIKGTSSRRINELMHTAGTVWQPESFDRIIRDESEYLEKLNYMWLNPVKSQLVDDPAKYPYFLNPMNVISI